VGVILDSSVLIAGERRGASVWDVLERVQTVCGRTVAALSAATAVELTHGIYRAKADADRLRRQNFVEELYQAVAVYPLTLEVARLAGRIHGEQMGRGVRIDFPDLIIGATVLYLGFDVATLNVKHFRLIPGLKIVTL
jgi:predicted nucleic acid-binding protein